MEEKGRKKYILLLFMKCHSKIHKSKIGTVWGAFIREDKCEKKGAAVTWKKTSKKATKWHTIKVKKTKTEGKKAAGEIKM